MKLMKRFFAGFLAVAVMFSFHTIGFIAIAEESENLTGVSAVQDARDTEVISASEEVIELEIDIPSQWSRDVQEWSVTTEEGTVLYYKTNPVLIQEEAWGAYTDEDAKLWNHGDGFSNGDGYIKFWAVKQNGDSSIVATREAVRYMYDNIPPDAFGLEKVEVGDNEFAIKNTEPIRDNLSGVAGAFYIINPENIETLEDIHNSGTEIEWKEAAGGFSFAFPCIKEMNESVVTVYVVDKAGNIQMSSIAIDTYKDFSAPELTVDGIKKQWVNRTDGWDVHSDSIGARVYYKTSDYDLEDWGSYTDSDVKIWMAGSVVPEGNGFIHFWAAYDDAERECAEKTVEYLYDATAPNEFVVEYEQKGSYEDEAGQWHAPKFIVYGSGIADATSGINQDKVFYKVKQNGAEWEGKVEADVQEVLDNNTIRFTLDLSNEERIQDAEITFYIVDNAGNQTACVLDENAVSYDPSVPEIVTGEGALCITSSADVNVLPLKYYSFGDDKLDNSWKSVYANGECYLKLTIKENDLREIVVTMDDGKSVTFTEDGRSNTPKWISPKEGNHSESRVYFLKLSDFGMSADKEHAISIVAKDSQNSSKKNTLTSWEGDTKVKYTLFYDPFDNGDSIISFHSRNGTSINHRNYYGKGFKDDILISLYDDNGIKNYSVDISGPRGFNKSSGLVDVSQGRDVEGNVKAESATEQVAYKIPYKEIVYTESVAHTLYRYDGKYTICVNAEDLAGNRRTEYYEFYVDTTSPSIVGETYTYNPSGLNYLPFGIFGNKSIDITIAVEDNETGCGLDDANVCLYWGGRKVKGTPTEKNGVKEYLFKKLPVGVDGVPYITVADRLDNSANYYFTTEEGKFAKKNKITNTHMALENKKPTAKIILPKEKQYKINGEIWYPSGFDYHVTAMDKGTGLNHVSVMESSINGDGSFEKKSDIMETGVAIKGKYTKFVTMADRFTKEAKYKYHMGEEGNYQIAVDAQDNAGNKLSDPDNSNVITKTVHIDKTNPEIVEFMFGGQYDNTTDMERGTYGFYFKDNTKVKVFVKDEGNSSGINYVTLYCRDINGQEIISKVYSSDPDNYHVENGSAYAEFTIEKGFKGQVWALVADRVVSDNPFKDGFKHTSGFKYADGTIIEDAALHQSVSAITISENIETNKSDSNGLPLYNTSVPLTIDVKDSFSGIAAIEWTITKDGSSGVIHIANDGSYRSDSEMAAIIDGSITRDSNLVTALGFNLTVSSNTNDNEVRVKLVDRSGNESEATKKYSIDTTSPTISASLSNQNPSNEMYYNTDQVVTITITERNFNPSDVKFMLNGNEQAVSNWSSSGEGDAMVNTGTFSINTDGDYSYAIMFTDMAGNAAEAYSQDMFVVDKTEPVLETNFDEFKTEDEKHYFGVDSIDKTAKITIVEHNFSYEETKVEIYKKEAGSEHNASGMERMPGYGWKDNGDEHTLEIPFNENDDGVYLIKVIPKDLASNDAKSQETVVFEIDFTNPVISERNGLSVMDEKESYENLDIYNEETEIEADFIPSVAFSDTNFDHLEYDLTVYTPEYENGKEIGAIVPKIENGNVFETTYSLPEFEKDGVYSVDVAAVDKAGNRSSLCRNTSVLMRGSDVLAYIADSNKKEAKGWYSLQKDEKTPISKRPDSFRDLEITVFAREDSKTNIILRDENGDSEEPGITADNSEDIYGIGMYNYTLPKEYFVENYPEGTNKDLYLWAENILHNEKSRILLGWIRIDALAPTCNIPSDLKKWKSYISSTKTITLTDISESLDKSQCVVYDNGKAVPQDEFDYSDDDDTLSYTLDKGWHDIGFILVDEAGNAYAIQEIAALQVGLFYCLWFWGVCGLIGVIGIIVAVVLIKKKYASD